MISISINQSVKRYFYKMPEKRSGSLRRRFWKFDESPDLIRVRFTDGLKQRVPTTPISIAGAEQVTVRHKRHIAMPRPAFSGQPVFYQQYLRFD
jgi:hypothetical protein